MWCLTRCWVRPHEQATARLFDAHLFDELEILGYPLGDHLLQQRLHAGCNATARLLQNEVDRACVGGRQYGLKLHASRDTDEHKSAPIQLKVSQRRDR